MTLTAAAVEAHIDQHFEDCMMCTGEKCAQCDWRLPDPAYPCQHDHDDRHLLNGNWQPCYALPEHPLN